MVVFFGANGTNVTPAYQDHTHISLILKKF